MTRRLMMVVATATLVLATFVLSAHDDKLHKATMGEVAAATADGFDLKTKSGVVKVKYSSKTKFELNGKPADKSGVKAGERAGVIGSKLPTGELMANEVLLGVPASKPVPEKEQSHKH